MSENQPYVGGMDGSGGISPTGLALAGPYQPAVQTGQRSGLPPVMDYCPVYRFWFVRTGLHRVQTRIGTFLVRAGQGLLLPPLSPQGVTTDGSSAWMRIDFTVCHRPRRASANMTPPQPTLREVYGVDLPPEIPAALSEEFRLAMERMSDLWWRSPLDHLEANAVLAQFLVRLLRQTIQPDPGAPADRPIDAAEAWAWNHLSERLTVADLAAFARMNRSHFSEVYRKCRGRTAQAFLDDLRLHLAKDLLATTGMSIADVSVRCGYGSPIAFSRRFRHHTGLTPTEWRTGGMGR